MSRKAAIGLILIVALFAFELFNFDTTRYALQDLLGDVNFWGLRWASVLAIAFCAIDFAGLARLFTPQKSAAEEPRAVWYLVGAWLLGATMNAIMTWWAVTLTLLSHDFGNEVLSREQLLLVVPVFVAALVWLTRILFIGAFSVAGEHIFDLAGRAESDRAAAQRPAPHTARRQSMPAGPGLRRVTDDEAPQREPVRDKSRPRPQRSQPRRPQRNSPPQPSGVPLRIPVGAHTGVVERE